MRFLWCKFAFYAHAYIPDAITSAADKMCDGMWFRSGNGFLMFILNHICHIHRPKWAFERWFIIRVDVRTNHQLVFIAHAFFQTVLKQEGHPLLSSSLFNVLIGNEERLAVSRFTHVLLIAADISAIFDCVLFHLYA